MIKLNLGCGSKHMEGFTNLDVSPDVGADVVHDLDVAPWPFVDGTVQLIVAEDVFEHVGNPILFMSECHRILKSGGALVLKVPHWQHQDAYTDPTHRRFCTEYTFDYWIRGTVLQQLHGAAYGGFTFERAAPPVVTSGAIYARLDRL